MWKRGRVLDIVEFFDLMCRVKTPGWCKDDYALFDSYRALLAESSRLANKARGDEGGAQSPTP